MTTNKTSPSEPAPNLETVADLIERLGGICPQRIRMHPAPGTATEQDLTNLEGHDDRLYELADGTLVEKAMGTRESMLATAIASAIRSFARPRKLGVVLGADGQLRLFNGLVRLPDVSYISWARMPGGRLPTQAVWPVFPDLAVEVVSDSNTPAEMRRKRQEYFEAGAQLVWIVDPDDRTIAVFTTLEQSTLFTESQTIDGGEVLPDFMLNVGELFAELDEQAG